MSAENVELIARGYEHYAETGDIYEAFLDENFEWHTASDLPDSDTYRGIAAVRAFIQGWPSAFEDFWGDMEEIVDFGEHVLACMTLRGRLRESGETVAMPEFHVWRFRDGKALEVREYRTRDTAIEAIEASRNTAAG